jgi:hypothetical protein
MTEFRYIRLMATAAIAAATLVVLIIVIVDPYGLFPSFWHPGGDNATRMPDPFGDNRVIRTALFLRQPKTILIGSSRVLRGYEVARLEGTVLGPAYNAAFYGYGLQHRLEMLKWAARRDNALKNVIIEVFPMDVMHTPHFWETQPLNYYPDALSYFSLFWSVRALQDSWENLSELVGWRSHSLSALSRTSADQTTLQILPATATINYSMFPPKAELDADWRNVIDKILDVCLQYKLTCKFVIAPVSIRALYGYYFFGAEETIAQLKRKLAATGAEVYDFLWANRFTAERLGDHVNHWEDPIHHSVDVGNFILDSLAGKTLAHTEPWERLFTVLTKDNVEADLVRLHAQVDMWVNENPEVRWSYSVVAGNVTHPIGTSEVTEIAGRTTIHVGEKSWTASGSGSGGNLAWNTFSNLAQLGMAWGWGADLSRKLPAERVAVICGHAVLGWSRPMFEMRDNPSLTQGLARTGFYFSYPVSKSQSDECNRPRFFSLFADGTARELRGAEVVPLR